MSIEDAGDVLDVLLRGDDDDGLGEDAPIGEHGPQDGQPRDLAQSLPMTPRHKGNFQHRKRQQHTLEAMVLSASMEMRL